MADHSASASTLNSGVVYLNTCFQKWCGGIPAPVTYNFEWQTAREYLELVFRICRVMLILRS